MDILLAGLGGFSTPFIGMANAGGTAAAVAMGIAIAALGWMTSSVTIELIGREGHEKWR
jgi:hypothetical protein